MFPVVAIIGVRQCGKTALAKSMFPNWRYVDLERPSDFNLIDNDIELFFRQNPEHVIIDEAQMIPKLFEVLRSVVDDKREQKGRFILTGSSSLELVKNLSESLAGRIGIVELGPMKTNELASKPMSPFYDIFESKLSKDKMAFGEANLTDKEIHRAWFYGGYPEPAFSGVAGFYQQWMNNYQSTYLNRDLARLFPGLNLVNYQRFLGLLSHLSGTILNKADLARALEVSAGTVKNYLDITEGTFVWRSLNSYERSASKSIVKMPKGLIRDSGLNHYLLRIPNVDELYRHPVVGHSFESFVIEEILRGLEATMAVGWDAYYFRTKNGAEVDLLLEGSFGLLPIEIKYGVTTTRSQLKSITNFVKENGCPFGLLVNQGDRAEWITEEIFQLPARYL